MTPQTENQTESQTGIPGRIRRWRWRHAGYAAVGVAVLLAIILGVLGWYVSTPQFAARVQQKLVATLERATGGTVEMRSFQWSARHLTLEIDDLTIHGREAPDQAPYFHVDRLLLQAKILSFFTPRVSLAGLVADHPTFHLILYPDGSTNQPQPRLAGKRIHPGSLLDLAIDKVRVQDGWILVNDRAIPWEMASGPLQLAMRYTGRKSGYRVKVETRNITFRVKNAAEAHSRLETTVDLSRHAVQVKKLDLKTGRSHLTLTAALKNFSDPVWRMNVHGSVDVAEAAAIAGVDGLRHGVAQLGIRAHGGPGPEGETGESAHEAFQVTGRVDMRAVDWESPRLRLHNVGLDTAVVVDNDQCSLPGFSMVMEDGGRISGSLLLKHCVSSAPSIGEAVWQARSEKTRTGQEESWPPAHGALSLRSWMDRLKRLHRPSPSTAAKSARKSQPLQGSLQAEVSGVTLPMVLAATAPKKYWNIGFTTASFGKVTAHWTGRGHDLDVHGDITMRAPPHTMGLAPVTGTAHADYLGDRRRLSIQQADVQTPATTIHASGLLTLEDNDPTSDLRVDVTSRDLGEYDRLLTDLDRRETPAGEPHALPVHLLGDATFHGAVLGSFFELGAAGHLDVQGFEMEFARAVRQNGSNGAEGATAPTVPTVYRLAWDGFHADISAMQSRLQVRNAELVRGGATIHLALELVPESEPDGDYTYNRQTRMDASVRANRIPLADLQSAMQGPWGKFLRASWWNSWAITSAASGTLSANGHFAGTIGNIDGSAQATLVGAVVDGQPIRRASISLVASGHTIAATAIHMSAAGGAASGAWTYDYETGALQGEMTGKNFLVERMQAIQKQRLPVGGTFGFHVQASGTSMAPVATATMSADKLTFDHRPAGNVNVQAQLDHGTVAIVSHGELLGSPIEASSHIQLGGDFPAEARLTFTGFNVSRVLSSWAPARLHGNSSIDGSITMSGPLATPKAIRGDAELKPFTVTLDQRPIHSVGAIVMTLRDGKLQLNPARLQGENAALSAAGNIDLLDRAKLRLHGEGFVDAALATVFDPSLQTSGQIQFDADVRGTARQPRVRGHAEVRHLNVHMLNVTNGLTDLNGTVDFDQDRISIQHLKGYSGGGALDIEGFLGYGGGGYGGGVFVDLTASADRVRIRYPKGVSSAVDGKLRLVGNPTNLLLSGHVKLMRFDIGNPLDFVSLAQGGGPISSPLNPASPLNRVRLDLQVTSDPELGLQNSFASLAGSVNLRIRGTMEDPSVLGRIDITHGTASLAGTKYQLQQGDIVFNNPVTISPEINIEASARVQTYDIVVGLHGPPNKLNVTYRSEPPLTQADVLALLALGRTNEQATMYGEQQQANANLTSEALLGGALNAAVSSRVQKLFGVGSVRVDPNFVGTLGESTARVTVEEPVGRSLTLTFATNVNTTAQQLIQAQYDLGRNMSIVAVRDEADVFSMYLEIRGKHK